MFAHKKAKRAMVISALLSLGGAGQMVAMQADEKPNDGKSGKLVFVLDSERRVKFCQDLGGMQFDKEPDEFFDEDILDVLSLSPKTTLRICNAFAKASIDQDEVSVEYAFNEGNYKASIIPVDGEYNDGFTVKVKKALAAQGAAVEPTVVAQMTEQLGDEWVKIEKYDPLAENEQRADNDDTVESEDSGPLHCH